jgi:hypothetical protein
VTSWACPGVMTIPIGRPSALVRALILVEKPPRERPSPLRSAPLSVERVPLRWGAKTYTALCSIVETGRLNGRSALTTIRDAPASASRRAIRARGLSGYISIPQARRCLDRHSPTSNAR